MKLALLFAIAALALTATVAAQEEQSSTLNFMVLRDYNGKPVQNASVILHPVTTKGKQGKGGYQLKTDVDGKTSFDGVPYGKLRVQVLARGFQTFGEDYDIDQPTTAITIKLKRPQGQYSIYQSDPGDSQKEQPKPQQ
jgi:Carboxypeptidase regulatory-like domain